MSVDAYCQWLSRHFYASGHDAEDLYQEARLAAWLAPECPRLAARRQVLDVVKVARRRSFDSTEYADISCVASDVVDDVVDARVRLRAVISMDLSDNERTALGRTFRGEPITRSEKALGVALWRLRRRLVT